jgi:ubiquinone/menaquinone biosynthesis C-methylase UbiE
MKAFQEVPIGRVRDFWNARPCNIRHSPRPIGEREYFDDVEARKYFVEPHIPRFAEFSRWAGKRVLEVGCGIGTDTVNFARAGARVTAIDLSDRSLDIARKRAAIYGLSGITFVQADAEHLAATVAVEPYDLVYSFGVIHHTPNPKAALDQMRLFLAPEGTLKLMVYHRFSWKALAIVMGYGRGALWKWDKLIAAHSEAQEGCPVTYTYTRRELRAFVESAGLQVRDMFVDHIFPWRIADYIQYRYRKQWYFAAVPAPAFRWLEKHVGWHLCITAGIG